jgi:HD-GYP domain-containing protein (c-di-GMP phosphodiesterase class II)
MEEGDRFAEFLGALSLASDHARGQPPESALGTTVLATRLARRVGLDDEETNETFFTAITRTLGCTSTAMEVAPLALGDDLSLGHAIHLSDPVDPGSIRECLEARFALDAQPEDRENAIDTFVSLRDRFPEMTAPVSQQAVALSSRLPLPANVPRYLEHIDSRWDGADPTRSAGDAIPHQVRIVELATVAELFRRAGGADAAIDMARSRSGSQFDPSICDAFVTGAEELLTGFDAPSLWQLFLDSEPAPLSTLGKDDRRLFAAVCADYADNKSGWFVGNSRRVARLAVTAGAVLDLTAQETDDLLMAGLLHDVGRCATPNGILDKPGPLTARERGVVDSQGRHTEQILAAAGPLRPIAALAGSARERVDGSGHPRGIRVRDRRMALLAAAGVQVALVSDRPWRPAFDNDDAAEHMHREAEEGRLSHEAVEAVLESHGHRSDRTTRVYPDGLTPREAEVLTLLASGLLSKQIAAKLGIAYKTVDNHVQNLYRKIGASTRTAAAMYAIDKGLYDS